MSIFTFQDDSNIGTVFSVDTSMIIIKVNEIENLRKLQVNHLLAVESSKAGQLLIGIINKITRKITDEEASSHDGLNVALLTENIVKVNLIGTFFDLIGVKRNVFKRTLDSVPEIDAKCYQIIGENITKFMRAITSSADIKTPLSIGKYSIDEEAEAFLDGDKLFQRHAVIVGSTGSGKSWCVAKIIEQIATLPMANTILFDIHGEYSSDSFDVAGIKRFKIANPSDLSNPNKLSEGILMVPYWLLTYEEMLAMLLDRSDSNAPNQAMLFSKTVFENKMSFLDMIGDETFKHNITIDSPIPYKIEKVIDEITALDNEMVASTRGEKQGPYFGKLTRFIQRLEAKTQDKRLGFIFQTTDEENNIDWLNNFCEYLMHGTKCHQNKSGVKIIDFSEVPSDVLPLVIGLISRIIFSVQQWTKQENRHPIALFCDEAHLYIPERTNQDSSSELGLKNFERIAKEGRKYGVNLTVISQRPSEVNRTVLSQCNNFISLRLSNSDDQAVIKKLLPDNLAGLTDSLPILDIGEALVVGDASLLPTRINISEPQIKPKSATINFWQEWSKEDEKESIKNAVIGLRNQSKF